MTEPRRELISTKNPLDALQDAITALGSFYPILDVDRQQFAGVHKPVELEKNKFDAYHPLIIIINRLINLMRKGTDFKKNRGDLFELADGLIKDEAVPDEIKKVAIAAKKAADFLSEELKTSITHLRESFKEKEANLKKLIALSPDKEIGLDKNFKMYAYELIAKLAEQITKLKIKRDNKNFVTKLFSSNKIEQEIKFSTEIIDILNKFRVDESSTLRDLQRNLYAVQTKLEEQGNPVESLEILLEKITRIISFGLCISIQSYIAKLSKRPFGLEVAKLFGNAKGDAKSENKYPDSLSREEKSRLENIKHLGLEKVDNLQHFILLMSDDAYDYVISGGMPHKLEEMKKTTTAKSARKAFR